MPRSLLSWIIPLSGALLSIACPAQSDDGDGGGVTGQSSQTGTSTPTGQTAPVTLSAEDGPEPVTCESLGGTCSCVGSCDLGQMPAPEGSCPQPPDEAGACSQECCLPIATTSSGTTAATTADSTADTGAPTCDCAALPTCATPEGEDCNGRYPDAHCCDDASTAMTCTCIEPCDGGFPCCTLQPGCA